MNKHKVIKQLEEVIEILRDDNNYITGSDFRTNLDIERATGNPGNTLLSINEVGKNINIDIDVEYKKHKSIDI